MASEEETGCRNYRGFPQKQNLMSNGFAALHVTCYKIITQV